MAKGKPIPNSKEKVLNWQSSGKTIPVWCKENKISYTTFLGWKKRFQTNSKTEAVFIELKDPIPNNPGIIMEYNGVKIHLQFQFDHSVLKQCLDCLKSFVC